MKTFGQHLQELKVRLLVYLAVLGVGSVAGFMIHKPVEALLQKPLNQTLYYSNPAGGLSFVMQIALGVGILLSLPVLLFQLMQFVRPAIKPLKTRFVAIVLACSLLLTALAVVYAYMVSMPAALHFLTTFNSEGVKALISVTDYLHFLFAYLLGTVIAFQLPLILFFANKIRRFPPGSLLKLQRPAVVGAIIFAGIITPTIDPINQLLVAVPIILLFEVGAIAVVVTNRVTKPTVVFEIKRPAQYVPLVSDGITTQMPARKRVAIDIMTATRPVPAATTPNSVRPVVTARPTRGRVIMDIMGPARPALG